MTVFVDAGHGLAAAHGEGLVDESDLPRPVEAEALLVAAQAAHFSGARIEARRRATEARTLVESHPGAASLRRELKELLVELGGG